MQRNIDAYMLHYIQYQAGLHPHWPDHDKYGISTHEGRLARRRADTIIRRLRTTPAGSGVNRAA